jgi:hypothetical protein
LDDSERGDRTRHHDDVKIEELSDSRLRITIGKLVTDVSVERTYHTHRSFGEFRSLDHLIEFLRKKSQEAE